MPKFSPRNLKKRIFDELVTIYSETESSSLAELILQEVFGLGSIQLVLNEEVEIQKDQQNLLTEILSRLKNHEPIQHILGTAEFYGRKFKVDKNVLIPRQETEELLQLIANENRSSKELKILDIGTGSGCLAITLALEISNSKVYAVDISEDALFVARQNSETLDAKVEFTELDILRNEIPYKNLDVIVSNPPYVTDSEKKQMSKNVLEYDPPMSLFVSDENPLLFYETILKKTNKSLEPGGKIYFEINERFGSEMKLLMESRGFSDVRIIKDINSKDRFAVGVKSY